VRAVVIREGALHVEERRDPEPGHGQVLVRVRAAGVNGADLVQLRGAYPAPPDAPADIPGLELAGEVAAVGPGVLRWQEGDRVMALVGGGGQAELAVVHERHLLPVPESLSWPEAGGFVEVFATAHDALFTQAGLACGERLLVQGGAGGVGIAAVQLGAAAGAEVAATVRADELREAVAGFGARVLAPGEEESAGPFDVVLELVGGPNLAADLEVLATGGRILVIGVSAGASAELQLLRLMGKRARIHGSTLRARSLEEKALVCRALEKHVLPLLSEGRVRVPVEAAYPLAEAAAAYERFAAGRKLGKIVLAIPG
jgi:NADPH2:quinone reductase